jgi:hypothetical protein
MGRDGSTEDSARQTFQSELAVQMIAFHDNENI